MDCRLAKDTRIPAFLALVVLGVASSRLRWSAVVTFLQKSVAESMRSRSKDKTKRWTNLGLWRTDDADEDYNEACENLARKLAEAAKLGEGDSVLASGCGRGDELTLYKDHFRVRRVTGVDQDPDAAATFSHKQEDVELLCKTGGDVRGAKDGAGCEERKTRQGTRSERRDAANTPATRFSRCFDRRRHRFLNVMNTPPFAAHFSRRSIRGSRGVQSWEIQQGASARQRLPLPEQGRLFR